VTSGGSIQALCKNSTAYLNGSGQVSIQATNVDNGSTAPAGIASLSITPNTFNCTQIGPQQVTLTVTDNNGATATCTATVNVLDTIKPIVVCKNISLVLSNGTASLLPTDIDNGSSDNCGIAQLSASTLSFTSVGTYSVTLTATDPSGNTSSCIAQVTVTNPPPSTFSIQIRCLIEGLYTGNGSMQPVLANNGFSTDLSETDTIEIALCPPGDAGSISALAKSVVSTNGYATAQFPGNLSGSSQYISIRYRSAVRIWSANPVAVSSGTTYDFTTSAAQAYGDNQVALSQGYFGLFSGDVAPQDDLIDILDQAVVDNDNAAFAFGYISSDVNGDGIVDVLDQMVIDNNVSGFIGAIQP
jgi:PKD repeat protein